jgi:hypothetical protein
MARSEEAEDQDCGLKADFSLQNDSKPPAFLLD